MKYPLFLIVAFFAVTSCNDPAKYLPETHLTEAKQEAFKYEIVRDSGRLPKRANQETKNDEKFNAEYQLMAKSMKLDYYYPNTSDGYIYFQTHRIAPSLTEKYVATGGRFKRDDQGVITEYEEIYRTWKMSEEELAKKTMFFSDMVKGKDLSPYYTANSGDTEHIEFPDEKTFFNKANRQWEMKGVDSTSKN